MLSQWMYRIGGQDWQFSNVTANSTYQFVGPSTIGINLTESTAKKTFEMRGEDISRKPITLLTTTVTNWAYG